MTRPITSASGAIGSPPSSDRTPNSYPRARRFERRLTLCALILAAIASLAALSPRATAAVYWGSERDGVGAANLDGSEPQWDYFYAFEAGAQGPSCDVAVSPAFLYWAAPGGIARRRLDGEGLYPRTVVSQPQYICGLALAPQHVLWLVHTPSPSMPSGGSLARANLDGSGATTSFITGLDDPCDVATGAGYVYWMERDGIGRARLDGSEPERPFLDIPTWHGSGCALVAGRDHLFWAQGGSIARADLDGGEVESDLVPAVGGVAGIAVDDDYVYWSANSAIGRAKLDGSEVQRTWIPSPTPSLIGGGIAVDPLPTPPYLTLPSRSIRFGRAVKYNLRSGAALLGVYVPPGGPLAHPPLPPAGQLSVRSRGLSSKVFRSDVSLAAEGGYSLWKLRIRPGRGTVAKRIRRRLRRTGRAAIKLRVDYLQDRVYPVSETRRVVLRRYPGAPKGWVKQPRRPSQKGTR